MILQKLYEENIKEQLKDIFEAWPEISYSTQTKHFEVNGKSINVFYLIPKEEDFEKIDGFESKEEAMGAFKTLTLEYGFEETPHNIAILHAIFDGNKLFMLFKAINDDKVEKFDQLSVEKLTQKLQNFQRVVIYSSVVLTYLTDLYPSINETAYVIPKYLSEMNCHIPELKDVAKIYGIPINIPEDEIKVIQKIVEDSKGICNGKALPPMEIPIL